MHGVALADQLHNHKRAMRCAFSFGDNLAEAIWEKRDDESAAAHEALRDYLRMGVRRSLRKLSENYLRRASSKRAAKQPPTTSLNSLETWSNTHEWVKRAQAYDADQQRRLDEAIAQRRRKLLDEEFKDFEAELARFRKVRKQISITETEVVDVKEETDDETGTVIMSKTVVESVNLGAHRMMTKWRAEISALGRRSMGMPERITEQLVDPDIDAEKQFKAYVGISPDDWDDDEAEDKR